MARPPKTKVPASKQKAERKYIEPINVRLRIKTITGKHNISQYKLAQSMGLQVGHIWKLFNESNPNPTLAMLEKVAGGLSNLVGKRIKIADLIEE